MSHGASFNIPDYYQQPQKVSRVWQLRKGKRIEEGKGYRQARSGR